MSNIVLKFITNKRFLLILLIVIGALLRFYNLNWGAPYYFHPDERNIVSSISQLHFPSQMNPHFFAYGSLPIYIIYFVGLIVNFFSSCHLSLVTCHVSFEQAILISRLFSALFSLFLIPVMYLLGRYLYSQKAGIIAAALTTFSIGLIQYAHFGTFELWLTFFSVLFFLFSLYFLKRQTTRIFLSLAFFLGILIAIKVSSLVFLLIPFILFFGPIFKHHKKPLLHIFKYCISQSLHLIVFFVIASSIYLLTNPFIFFDTTSFLNSMKYESAVAFGALSVFYTGEFLHTIPVLFQLQKIFPFLLNPFLAVFFIISFFYLLVKTIRLRKSSYGLLLLFFSLLFFSQAFLFAKWTRYMIPTLPFIYLLLAIFFTDTLFPHKKQQGKSFLQTTSLGIILSITTLFAISYFLTAFVHKDTRIQATNWAKNNIPHETPILSEVYDMGIVPFNDKFKNITLFNFYDLDQNTVESNAETLEKTIMGSSYIILPSQRILKSRLLNKKTFPKAHAFYNRLLADTLHFETMYTTPCDVFCRITYLGNPLFSYEDTVAVFDRPTLMIFRINHD